MNPTEMTWTTSSIVLAVAAILIIFYVAWRFVNKAAKGNRRFRRRKQFEREQAGDNVSRTDLDAR